MPEKQFQLSETNVLDGSMSESDSEEEVKVAPKSKYEESKRI